MEKIPPNGEFILGGQAHCQSAHTTAVDDDQLLPEIFTKDDINDKINGGVDDGEEIDGLPRKRIKGVVLDHLEGKRYTRPTLGLTSVSASNILSIRVSTNPQKLQIKNIQTMMIRTIVASLLFSLSSFRPATLEVFLF